MLYLSKWPIALDHSPFVVYSYASVFVLFACMQTVAKERVQVVEAGMAAPLFFSTNHLSFVSSFSSVVSSPDLRTFCSHFLQEGFRYESCNGMKLVGMMTSEKSSPQPPSTLIFWCNTLVYAGGQPSVSCNWLYIFHLVT